MAAGDMALQTEILYGRVLPMVDEWVKGNPDQWLPVFEAVQIYCDAYNIVRAEKINRACFAPFGFTQQTFNEKQKTLDPAFVKQMQSSVLEYQMNMPPTQTIIAGVEPGTQKDTTRSRLYVIDRDDALCFDSIRFAAIGSGAPHANSHFMVSGYGSEVGLQETLLSVYTAKKKAEVAPGVGKDTIMFAVGPALGTFQWIGKPIQSTVDLAYREVVAGHDRITKMAYGAINDFLKASEQAQSQSDQTGPAPSN
jgi:hypothetical protein